MGLLFGPLLFTLILLFPLPDGMSPEGQRAAAVAALIGMMMAAVLAASFTFMLPAATPPNAIVYGSRYVTIMQMARAEIWLNLLGAVVITVFAYALMPRVWGISLAG